MKKLILGLSLLAIAATTTFVACTKNGVSKTEANTQKEGKNLLRATTNNSFYSSLWTQKIGVDSIKYTSTTSATENFDIYGSSINVNGITLDLNSATFSVEKSNNITTLKVMLAGSSNLVEFTLNDNNKTIFDVTNNIVVDSLYFEDIYKSTMLSVAMFLYDATFNPSPEGPQGLPPRGPGCDIEVVTVSHRKSLALSHLARRISILTGPGYGCTAVPGIDTGCLWGDFCCVAVQEVHCPNC